MTRWFFRLAAITLALLPGARTSRGQSTGNFVGLEGCTTCHKSEKSGNQVGTWKQSRHAEAYNTLSTPHADEIASAKGVTGPAKDAAACLECHTIRSEKLEDRKLGVQCEACHGPGSEYRKLSVMKDKEKSIAAGMTRYADNAAIEAQCRTCHNEKSPTFKEFNFEEKWAKIKHPKPAG